MTEVSPALVLRSILADLNFGPHEAPTAMLIAERVWGDGCFVRVSPDEDADRVVPIAGGTWHQAHMRGGRTRDEEHWAFVRLLSRWLAPLVNVVVDPEALAFEIALPLIVFRVATPEDLARRLVLPPRVVLARMGQLGIGEERNAPLYDLGAARRARMTVPVDLHGEVANDTERRRRTRAKGAA